MVDTEQLTDAPKDLAAIDERAEYIAGLRAFADALEAHADVPLPLDGKWFSPLGWNLLGDDGQRQTAALIIKSLGGSWNKSADGYFYARTSMRGLHLEIAADREQVCARRVVGTEVVVKKVATAYEEQEVEQDIVEWDCGSLLAGTSS